MKAHSIALANRKDAEIAKDKRRAVKKFSAPSLYSLQLCG